jgi:hypothetical protein
MASSNAYELADKLQIDKARALLYVDAVVQSANMLRQQAERIAELENKLSFYEIKDLDSGLNPKPLSDEEISQVYKEISEPFGEKRLYEIHDFARAIEERHGIK